MGNGGAVATAADWRAAQVHLVRNAYVSMVVGLVAVPVLVVGSTMLADAWVSGGARYVVAAAITVTVFGPLALGMVRSVRGAGERDRIEVRGGAGQAEFFQRRRVPRRRPPVHLNRQHRRPSSQQRVHHVR